MHKPTLSARELRHKAVLRKIERLQQGHDDGIKAIVKAVHELPALVKKAARLAEPPKPRQPKPEPIKPEPKPKRQRKPKAVTAEPDFDALAKTGAAEANARIKAKAITMAELPGTVEGQANAKSWEAIPAVRKAAKYAEEMEAAGFRRNKKD